MTGLFCRVKCRVQDSVVFPVVSAAPSESAVRPYPAFHPSERLGQVLPLFFAHIGLLGAGALCVLVRSVFHELFFARPVFRRRLCYLRRNTLLAIANRGLDGAKTMTDGVSRRSEAHPGRRRAACRFVAGCGVGASLGAFANLPVGRKVLRSGNGCFCDEPTQSDPEPKVALNGGGKGRLAWFYAASSIFQSVSELGGGERQDGQKLVANEMHLTLVSGPDELSEIGAGGSGLGLATTEPPRKLSVVCLQVGRQTVNGACETYKRKAE